MSLVFAVIFDADIANGVNPTQTAKCCTVPLGDVSALTGVDAVSATMTVVNNLMGTVDFRKGPFKIRVYEAPEGFNSKAVQEPVSFSKEQIDALIKAKTPEEAAAAIGLGHKDKIWDGAAARYEEIRRLEEEQAILEDYANADDIIRLHSKVKLDDFVDDDSDSDGDVHEELGVSKDCDSDCDVDIGTGVGF